MLSTGLCGQGEPMLQRGGLGMWCEATGEAQGSVGRCHRVEVMG